MSLIWFAVIPFLIGAAFHFFGIWAGIPALVVGGIVWIGAVTLIYEEHKK